MSVVCLVFVLVHFYDNYVRLEVPKNVRTYFGGELSTDLFIVCRYRQSDIFLEKLKHFGLFRVSGTTSVTVGTQPTFACNRKKSTTCTTVSASVARAEHCRGERYF